MPAPFTALIMAAGKGTRMRSELPKVLHPVCGRPMIEWVVDAARAAGAAEVVCITRPGDGVADGLADGVTVVEQAEGEGTGAAVLAARENAPDGNVLVLSGDHPLITAVDQCEILEENAILRGGGVLPGFELSISEWFERAERQAGQTGPSTGERGASAP